MELGGRQLLEARHLIWARGGEASTQQADHLASGCGGEVYYEQYYLAYGVLQNIARQDNPVHTDPARLNASVASEYAGIWGDMYIDNRKRALFNNRESQRDEGVKRAHIP